MPTSKMMLQLGITYDDLVFNQTSLGQGGFSNFPQTYNAPVITDPLFDVHFATSLTPFRVLRNVNLPSGRYKCVISGVEVTSGRPDATYAFARQIISIASPQFLRQGGQVAGLPFANNNQYTIQDTGGERSFIMELAGSWIELDISIAQFNPQLVNEALLWSDAYFAFIILTLDVELENSQALFGNAK